MNDNGTINLKNLRKSPPAPAQSAPVSMPVAHPNAPAAIVRPPPPVAPASSAMRPGMAGLLAKTRQNTDWPWWAKRAGAALVVLAILYGAGHYIYANFWTKSPFGPTPGAVAAPSAPEASAQSASAATSTLTAEDIVARVGKIMLLPADEVPTLAGVSDPTILSGQDFFKNASIGDVVLMYAKSRRAILYDPVQNKIIEVAPITDATSTQP